MLLYSTPVIKVLLLVGITQSNCEDVKLERLVFCVLNSILDCIKSFSNSSKTSLTALIHSHKCTHSSCRNKVHASDIHYYRKEIKFFSIPK